MTAITRLESFLADHAQAHPLSEPVVQTVLELAEASLELHAIAAEEPPEGKGVAVGINPDGDAQVPLDVIADDIFLRAARRAPVSAYASEEQVDPIVLDPARPVALAIDPLDGSSNVALNLSYGVIFGILPTAAGSDATHLRTFLQPGRMQLAAGLIIFGPRLNLVLTLGEGTHIFTFSPAADGFVLTRRGLQVPVKAKEFAINASNYRHWDGAVQLYFDDCIKGVHGPREQNYNMRWLASVVVEAFRILHKGGVFLYPADRREGYGEGRLRLVYEANPIALLIEQAGGLATDGIDPILMRRPERLHQRTPLIFGSRREVAKVGQYRAFPVGEAGERSPLFGERGLFRV